MPWKVGTERHWRLDGCGIAADYLGLSIKKLGALLVELRNRGLIDRCTDKSLRILDIEALQELADQHDDPARAGHKRALPIASDGLNGSGH